MKRINCFFILIIVNCFSALAHAQVWEAMNANADTPPEEPVIRQFKESDFQNYPWLKEFTNVVVINKADEGPDRQSLKLYVNGRIQLVTKISSGREKHEKGCEPGQDPKADHCSVRAYWSTTPVGYFDVDQLDPNYFSKLWKTWMPWAVFFEPGIATHQAPAGTENNLSRRASGGCVRMHPNMAPILYKAVESAGQGLIPVVGVSGELKKTKAGDTIRKIGYKTLYIVQNVK